jgi:hypothetical protein
VTSRLKRRIDRLSGDPACPTCGGGSGDPRQVRVVFRGLRPKYGAPAAEESPPGPERCPTCGRPLVYRFRMLGLQDLPRGEPLEDIAAFLPPGTRTE